MDAGLVLYIKESFNNDKADLIFESFEVFNQANIDDYENDFVGLLMEESNIERSDLAPMFEAMVVDLLFSTLMDYGVKLNSDTPLEIINLVCKGIDAIEYYLGTDDITTILESDLNKEEKLADILECSINADKDIILIYLEDANISLLNRIQEIFDLRVIVPTIDIETQAINFKITTKLKNFNRFLTNEDFIGIKLLNAGVIIGSPFDQYLRYFEHKLDDMSVDQAAKELLILLFMSCDGIVSATSVYQKYSSILFHDLDKITKVFSQINKLTLEFDRYMLQRNSSLLSVQKEESK